MQTYSNASKLAVVRESLKSNPNVVITDIIEEFHLPATDTNPDNFIADNWLHGVSFIVAPKKGLYIPEELKAFMYDLVPGVEPTFKEDFKLEGKGLEQKLNFGRLVYFEPVGEEKLYHVKIVELSDKELAERLAKEQQYGSVKGHKTFKQNNTLQFRRGIWVRPYPDVAIANTLNRGDGQYKHSISLKDLRVYQEVSAQQEQVSGKGLTGRLRELVKR